MPEQTTPTHYLTDREVGQRYRVSRATVWRWTRNGLLPTPVRLSPGVTRWRLSEIEASEHQAA